MPTYEYECRDCGAGLEVRQSFSDSPLQVCERCGGRLRKRFSAPAIKFVGSGYYVNDSRKKSAKGGSGDGGRSKESSDMGSSSSDSGSSKSESGSSKSDSGSSSGSDRGTKSGAKDSGGKARGGGGGGESGGRGGGGGKATTSTSKSSRSAG